jgi:hypothetical protein
MVIAAPPGQLRLAFVTAPIGPSDNRTHSPRFDAPQPLPDLHAQDSALIDRLLEMSTQYHHEGQDELSALIDRIGMRLMQMFLARSPDTPATDPQEAP